MLGETYFFFHDLAWLKEFNKSKHLSLNPLAKQFFGPVLGTRFMDAATSKTKKSKGPKILRDTHGKYFETILNRSLKLIQQWTETKNTVIKVSGSEQGHSIRRLFIDFACECLIANELLELVSDTLVVIVRPTILV